ncbi:CDP-6-deoxy-delta-3,4-glucoseen reductase [Azospira sp. I13]|uniref:translesion DNA synthesis-associated protein ImuA n=1 Tax=Azospira sp. I13 TaxID=1765050 RepID=UPI000D467B90|nr:translesion DNA synthesis-associated protein ImuA [Azospira sp. I13]GBG02754.1 CDP-6-deoxy-delta-3,4-glucoseen reductase [Azospira sp. I13]
MPSASSLPQREPPRPDAGGLAELLARPDIWRGDRLAASPRPGLPTGHPALDRLLPGGGWPRGALSEFLATPEVGVTGLLAPALAALAGPLLFVNPPWPLHAPGWQAAGFAAGRLAVVEANGKEGAWACEVALEEGGFAALLAWLPDIDAKGLRRLQLAAAGQPGLACILRPPARAREPSPAPLRLSLENAPRGLRVRLLKRRGGDGLAEQPLILTPALAVTALLERDRALALPALPLPAPGRPGAAARTPAHA